MRTPLSSALGLAGPLFGACLCLPSPTPGPLPPPQEGDCTVLAGEPGVEPGTGQHAFVALVDDGTTDLQYGAQGGIHVWASVKTTGFGPALVKIDVEARDAYSLVDLGAGAADDVRLNQLPAAPPGTCDFHGIPMFLDGRYDGSGGLATVTATVTAPDGRTATAARRLWLGAALPACVPLDGAVATLATRLTGPNLRPGESARDIADGETLDASQDGESATRLHVGVFTTGLAASALRLHADLRDPAADPSAPPLASADAETSPFAQPPSLSAETPPRCIPPAQVQLPVDAALEGRLVDLVLHGDDGHGHVVDATRHVRLHRLVSPPPP